MAFESLSHEERTSLTSRHLAGVESWLRRLADYQLRKALGPKYITENATIGRRIREPVAVRLEELPADAREVDATTFGNLIALISNQNLYQAYFHEALSAAFPRGAEEFRHFAERLVDIRNHVAHGHAASSRQAERAVCYANDIVESLSAYFRGVGMANEYDVPLIVAYVDSLGNSSTLQGVPMDMSTRNIDWRKGPYGDLRPGMLVSAEVTVDPTFAGAEYTIHWQLYGREKHLGSKAEFAVDPTHVGEQLELVFEVKTDRLWHRDRGIDDSLVLLFRVLPPV